APAVGRAPAAPSRPDTSAPKVDTARVRKLLSERPVPYDRLVVQTTQPLAPGGKYLVRVRGATNLSGVSADGQGVLVVPVPKPAPPPTDTTKARPTPPSPTHAAACPPWTPCSPSPRSRRSRPPGRAASWCAPCARPSRRPALPAAARRPRAGARRFAPASGGSPLLPSDRLSTPPASCCTPIWDALRSRNRRLPRWPASARPTPIWNTTCSAVP